MSPRHDLINSIASMFLSLKKNPKQPTKQPNPEKSIRKMFWLETRVALCRAGSVSQHTLITFHFCPEPPGWVLRGAAGQPWPRAVQSTEPFVDNPPAPVPVLREVQLSLGLCGRSAHCRRASALLGRTQGDAPRWVLSRYASARC